MACLGSVVPDLFACGLRQMFVDRPTRGAAPFPRLAVYFLGDCDEQINVRAAGAPGLEAQCALEDPERWDGLS